MKTLNLANIKPQIIMTISTSSYEFSHGKNANTPDSIRAVDLPRCVRRFADWTAKDKKNWTRIIAMRAHGWSMKQMTTGTRLKRFTIERLLKEYRDAHPPTDSN